MDKKTHNDLCPEGMCPSLMMKRVLTHGMDDEVLDDRPGRQRQLRTRRNITTPLRRG